MFEGLSARELVDVITARARSSAAADAEKYAAIAELARRRLRDGVELEDAAADATDGAAAEIGAALNIGHGRALGEIEIATMLRDTFPRVAELFHGGLVTGRRVWILAKRTDLVVDPDVMAQLDRVLADRIVGWGPVSEWKFEQLVDAEIARIDPAAVHRVREQVRDRDFVVGRHDGSGTVAYWGRMTGPDAAIAVTQIRRMARSVCPDDPRTLKQRRGDAHAALMAGSTVLRCLCENPDCPAAAEVDDAAASSVSIHVITDQATLDTALGACVDESDLHGPRTVEGELDEILDEVEEDAQHDADTRTDDHVEEPPVPDEPSPDEPPVPDEPPTPRPTRPLAIIPGHGVVPPPLLAELIRRGATVKPLVTPTGDAEPRYRPSAATDHFVRLRDLTCRAPGCDRLAEFTDIDHTVPYPAGPTHAGGLKCDCRKHHLIKTFHAGWSEEQLPDGTVITTTPTGHTYTTKPGITLLFPDADVTTPAPRPTRPPPPSPYRSMMMPRRKRTRAQARADRIKAERAQNLHDDEPPPF
ncbi:HNH endonuclease signature motif containing protein [Mycolicibacterium arenosum]|uniref:HNH endonuclease n=1 Tax=Mycolicibacterium arenosum TaxID=2952157 RepID=A0ABT1LWU1_9MYCO|nr:HNH endonuclease signature motif containing protein [Mycolicibacterium sp. CAU 1645]MCP9270810.1 HNH endonuclease [Mycolicibacterium sp. CAU 1645]